MKRKTYWKEVRRTFTGSKGRILSIALLMALGSFALVGLKVTSPNMQRTGEHFFKTHHTADLAITGSYGLNQTDQDSLAQLSKEADIEYGYFKDVVIKGTSTTFRLFSKPKTLSTYQVIQGKLPSHSGEIALSSPYQKDYKIGDTIQFSEPSDASDQQLLKTHRYKITGFVNSSELLSKNRLGVATAGTGELQGYAVVDASDFTPGVYTIARVAYKDLRNKSPFTTAYTDAVAKKRDQLKKIIKDLPQKRLTEIKTAGQAQLDQTKQNLANAMAQINQTPATTAEETQTLEQAKTTLAGKQEELEQAQTALDATQAPSYRLMTRREIPGSQGYIAYENNITIIHDVSNIFPVALYFLAALVTFVTMGRFVEEERSKAGIFKALGYEDRKIINKFTTYGFVASIVGTLIGVVTGHTLLPTIIHNTYKRDLLLPAFELHFYPGLTVVAILLGLVSAVLPAFLVAKRELSEKPSQLFLPKPPRTGSKILLEHITPLWKRMTFTQKVTARNIFRYKQRMFMTLFGVAGSIALLFAGLGMRASVSTINEKQFKDIIRYDMIVAKQPTITESQNQEVNQLLNSSAVKEHLSVHYETLQKVAGKNRDTQEITTLVARDDDQKALNNYIHLQHRRTGQNITLTNKGVVISEKLAKLLKVGVGDSISVQNSQEKAIKLKVAAITEMYLGHYIFMTDSTYEKAFGAEAVANADLVTLANSSKANLNQMSTQFMNLPGVLSVVQNNNLQSQVNTLVTSLSRVIGILIVVSVLLAVVVLYNLTNINVAERIHELSTVKVLGFYNKEVTLYIYRETIFLSLVGILVGFGLGHALHLYMVQIIPPDNILFDPAINWTVYLIPTIVIIIILIILGFIVNRRLRHINMLDALSSVE